MPITVTVPPAIFRMPLKVRYYEADQQAVVYHSWYLNYFDEAFMAFVTDRGYDFAANGTDVMLVHTEIDWHDSLRWPSDAEIAVSPVAYGNSSITVDYAALHNGKPVASARTIYVVVDGTNFTRMPVPAAMREALGDPAPLRALKAGR